MKKARYRFLDRADYEPEEELSPDEEEDDEDDIGLLQAFKPKATGRVAEKILLGGVESSDDIHGSITDERFRIFALAEGNKVSEADEWIKNSIERALTDFGLQLLDRASGQPKKFIEKGYIKPNEIVRTMITDRHKPLALRLGLRAFAFDRQLQKTIERIKINAGAVQVRKRLKKALPPGILDEDVDTLQNEMDRIRSKQLEPDPNDPQCHLGGNMLFDLEKAFDRKKLEAKGLEFRYYSASGTLLDYAGGIDCWIELYDLKKQRPIRTFSIDITSSPLKHSDAKQKGHKRKMAHYVFHFPREAIRASGQAEEGELWEVDDKIFQTYSYKNMIERAIQRFDSFVNSSKRKKRI